MNPGVREGIDRQNGQQRRGDCHDPNPRVFVAQVSSACSRYDWREPIGRPSVDQ